VLLAELAHGRLSALETLAEQVDAVFGPASLTEDHLEGIFGPMPRVVFDARLGPSSPAGIAVDFTPGIREAIEHFVARGRNSVVMLDWSVTGECSHRDGRSRKSWARGASIRACC